MFTGLPTDPTAANFGALTLTVNGSTSTISNNEVITADELGDITYTVPASFLDVFRFFWQASDGTSFSTAAPVFLGVELPHEVQDITKNTDANHAVNFTDSDFSDSSIYSGAPLQGIQIESRPQNGILELNGSPISDVGSSSAIIPVGQISTLTYVPNANFTSGTDTFLWSAWDGFNFSTPTGSGTGSVLVDVFAQPTINNSTKSAFAGGTVTFAATDFTNFYSGSPLVSVTILSLPLNSTLTLISGNNSGAALTAGQVISSSQLANLALITTSTFSGFDSFNWQAFDGIANTTVSATMSLKISPSLSTINQFTDQNFSLNLSSLTFATAYAGSPLQTVKIGRVPSHGSLSLTVAGTGGTVTSLVKLGQIIPANQLGGLTYKPAKNFKGPDSILMTANDGTSNSAGSTVNLTVTLPLVGNFTTDVGENTPFDFSSDDFNNNFSGAGSLTQLKLLSLPAHGILSFTSGTSSSAVTVNTILTSADLNTLIYTPVSGFQGPDSFAFTASDINTFAAKSASVNLTVRSMLVTGNGNPIDNGETTPSAANFTDLGDFTNSTAVYANGITRTYTIQNITGSTINLATPVVSGANAADFTVTTLPASTLTAGASTTLTVTFKPTVAGAEQATITIGNGPDTSSLSSFAFNVEGAGLDMTNLPGPSGVPIQIASFANHGFSTSLQSGDLNTAVASGNTLIVALSFDDVSGTVTVSDGHGDNFTLDADVSNASNIRTMVFSLPVASNPLAVTDQITATFQNSADNAEIEVYSVSGLLAVLPADQSQTATGSSNTPDSGFTATTTQSNELLFGVVGMDVGNASFSPGSGYTGLNTVTSGGNAGDITMNTEFQIASAAGSYHADGTITSGTAPWAAAIVTYKSGGGSGLLEATTQAGKGAGAVNGEIINMTYTGRLLDGTVFDASANHGNVPFTFRLDDSGLTTATPTFPFISNNTVNTVLNTTVIDGWEFGLQGIKPGEHRTLVIPASLAYGDSGTTGVPPGATLIFDVVCVSIDGSPSLGIVNALNNGQQLVAGASVFPGAAPSIFNGTDFGTLTLGQSFVSQEFFATDNSPDDMNGATTTRLEDFAFKLTGPDARDFIVQGNFTQFSIFFKPIAVGVRTAVVHLQTNDPLHPDFAFTIQGTALAPFSDLVISGFGEKIQPPVSVGIAGAQSMIIPVIVQNFGNAPIPSSTPATDVTITLNNPQTNTQVVINANPNATYNFSGLGPNKTKVINVPVIIPAALAGVANSFTATVNATQAIAESVTGNNSNTSSVGFNLTGNLVSTTIPPAVQDNGSFNGSMIVEVINNGTFVMPAGTKATLSIQAVSSGSTITLGSRTVNIAGLKPVETLAPKGHFLLFNVPIQKASATDGTYQLQAVINTSPKLMETSVTDNVITTTPTGGSLTMVSEPPGIDLSASFAALSQLFTQSGGSLHMSLPITVSNNGPTPVSNASASTDIQVFVRNGNTGVETSVGQISRQNLEGLAAGQPRTVDVPITLPVGFAGTNGGFTFIVKINASGAIIENNTTNNSDTTDYDIGGSLVSTNLPSSLSHAGPATSGKVTVNLENFGINMPLNEQVNVQILLHNLSTGANTPLNGNGTLVSTVTWTGPGMTNNFDIPVTIISGQSAGNYQLEAVLTLTPGIPEINLGNNTLTTTLASSTLPITIT